MTPGQRGFLFGWMTGMAWIIAILVVERLLHR